MFDHIVMRRSVGGQSISAGEIAEALLFYQKVQLVIDRRTLHGLIKQIGMPQLLTLLRRPDFSAVYCEEGIGTHTETIGVLKIHNYIAMTVAGDPAVGEIKTVVERIAFDLRKFGLSSAEAKRSAKAFLDLVPVRKFSGNHFIRDGVTNAATSDTLDLEYSRQAIKKVLEIIPGGYSTGPNFKFDVIETDLGLNLFTNIDFKEINRRRHLLTPAQEPITEATLLTGILEARADLALASFYGGDFVTSAINSSIIQVRHAELLRRSEINTSSLQNFSEVVIPDTKSVAEVIDSGERSFSEFLILLDKASRFKIWAKGINPDEGLVRSYMQEVSSEGWMQRTPQKTMRYVISTAVGATHPVIGLIAGFTDTFLLDKLLSGWKPNHFINTRLKPFVKST